MKQLTCEMCGSTDLVKQDGVYVCQTCGTKYSVEDAQKMMVEGTVEVSGTVKVDDTSKIENYHMMAENAYEAGNKKEAENYCNKIIEIDPSNYKAWFLKGKTAGWQSTLANVRIEESINCFTNAIDNAPEDEIEEIKNNAESEIVSLYKALISLCCNNFAKYPSVDNKNSILKIGIKCISYSTMLISRCSVAAEHFDEDLSVLVNNAAMDAWKNVITRDYKHENHPSDYEFETFVTRCYSCISLLEEAVTLANLSGAGRSASDILYKNLVLVYTKLEKACSYEYINGSYHVKKFWGDEKKKEFVEKIKEYHEKIKEIDPSYEIPQSVAPTPNPDKACYIATAVYGSYDCPQVWTLRRFRDYTLAETWYGRAFIRIYYATSPTLVRWFGHTDWFKKMWKGKLDRMVARLQSEGVESTIYEDREW